MKKGLSLFFITIIFTIIFALVPYRIMADMAAAYQGQIQDDPSCNWGDILAGSCRDNNCLLKYNNGLEYYVAHEETPDPYTNFYCLKTYNIYKLGGAILILIILCAPAAFRQTPQIKPEAESSPHNFTTT